MEKKLQNHKIFLVGLSAEFTKNEILNHFSSIYRKCRFTLNMKTQNNGRNLGWAILNVDVKSIKNSILKKHEFFLQQRKFFAKNYLSGKKLKGWKQELKKRRIFLNGLPSQADKNDLYQFFGKFGELEDAYIIKRYENELSTVSWNSGFGFVVFRNLEDATALLKMGKVKFQNCEVLVEEFQTKQEKYSRRKQNKYLRGEEEEIIYEKKQKVDLKKDNRRIEYITENDDLHQYKKFRDYHGKNIETQNQRENSYPDLLNNNERKPYGRRKDIIIQEKDKILNSRNYEERVFQHSNLHLQHLQGFGHQLPSKLLQKERKIPGFTFMTDDRPTILKVINRSIYLNHQIENLKLVQITRRISGLIEDPLYVNENMSSLIRGNRFKKKLVLRSGN